MTRGFSAAASGFALALSVSGGCSWDGADGRRHLILGIGVVTVASAAPTEDSAAHARVERVEATGVLLGAGGAVSGLLIGTAARQSVCVDPGTDVLVEAAAYEDGRFHVNIAPVYEDAGAGRAP